MTDSILPMSQSFGHSPRQVNRLIQRDLGARTVLLGITLVAGVIESVVFF